MSRSSVHSGIYLFLLALLAVGMTTSVFLANMAWVLLGVNWLIEGDWREKWRRARESRLLHAFLVLMAVHLLWLVGNEYVAVGLDDIRQKLPLLVLPLVILTSKPLSRKQLGGLAVIYLATVTVMTLVGLVRFLTIADLPYRNIIPTISHIRFGLNICFSICLVIYLVTTLREGMDPRRWRLLLVASGLWIAWCLYFLFLLQSYTSFLILLVLLLALPWLVPVRHPRLRWYLLGGLLLALVGIASAAVWVTNDYYGDCRRDGDKVENGSYIYQDVDSLSMAAGWCRVAEEPLDTKTDNGYSIYSTLVRYLNATHRSKDSLGVVSLTPADVSTVKQGIANPIYLRHPSVRKMAYMALFEYESYRCGDIKDFSLLERFALWRNAWRVFSRYPLLGVGTGDVMAACQVQLWLDGMYLIDNTKSAHNQYLIFLMAFGLVGVTLIVFFFVRAVAKTAALHTPLACAYLLILLLSFIGENTLGTLAGCLFAVFPWVLLAGSSESDEPNKTNRSNRSNKSNKQSSITHNQ